MSMFDNDEYVTANFDTLMRQASSTASDYMRAAVDAIDKQFGTGYAKAHPELVAAFMQTAAADFSAGLSSKTLGHALTRITTAIDDLADAIRADD